MNIVPLGDKVVVTRFSANGITSKGIFLPDIARDKPQEGRVISVGDGRMLKDGSRAQHLVNEGDRVLFDRYSGTEVDVDGETLLVMSESDILAVVR
jgi:chaperonin GroES